MKLSEQIKPISYLKSHATEVIDAMQHNDEAMVITQNGEAKLAVLGIEAYEALQESIALMKLLALGQQQIVKKQYHDIEDVFTELTQEDAY